MGGEYRPIMVEIESMKIGETVEEKISAAGKTMRLVRMSITTWVCYSYRSGFASLSSTIHRLGEQDWSVSAEDSGFDRDLVCGSAKEALGLARDHLTRVS
jgi:hypothetical protein